MGFGKGFGLLVTENKSFPELGREVHFDGKQELGLDGGLQLPVVAENLDALPGKVTKNVGKRSVAVAQRQSTVPLNQEVMGLNPISCFLLFFLCPRAA